MNKYSVLSRPLLSEKSTLVRENLKQYTFKIDLRSTKADVRLAIEAMYGVKVAKVQTLITRGKVVRKGTHVSMTSKSKKAVVTLVEGAKLPLFEEQ
ncbi:MAG: 50S ribosomal protein L23 [Proteobacteria bacterium]|nr:50S ribosomal protein L23 [Pseudomonadota bacterium]